MTKRKKAGTRKRSRRHAPKLIEWGLFVEYKQNKKGSRKHPIAFDLIVHAPASATNADLLHLAASGLPEDEKWRTKLLRPAWTTFSKGKAVKGKKKTQIRAHSKSRGGRASGRKVAQTRGAKPKRKSTKKKGKKH